VDRWTPASSATSATVGRFDTGATITGRPRAAD
jgi:hypothetical protein